jgi:hypothetical protein
MLRWRILPLWFLLMAPHIPSQAYACPVCGVGRDGTTSAYLMTAALMSIVPLVMAGAIVYYLFRQVKQGQALVANALRGGITMRSRAKGRAVDGGAASGGADAG